jgi:hypothetical protein
MDEQPESTGESLSLTLAVFGLGGFLLFLVLISGGWFLYVPLIALVVGGVGFFHWVLWGQSMSRQVQSEEEDLYRRAHENESQR